MRKINFKMIGNWVLNTCRDNASTIAGGLSMIGLALLCRKLDIPYQVLTEPIGSNSNRMRTSSNTPASVYLMPTNPVEASMGAIYSGIRNNASDYDRKNAAEEICSILKSNKNEEDRETMRIYAISLLQAILSNMSSSYYRGVVSEMISKIGKGEI